MEDGVLTRSPMPVAVGKDADSRLAAAFGTACHLQLSVSWR